MTQWRNSKPGSACAHGQAGVEELDRPDGQRIAGRIEGDARSGFRFAPRGGGPPIALEPGAMVRREGQGQGPGPGARPGTRSRSRNPLPAAPVWLAPPSTVSAAMCTALWTAGAGLAVFPVHKLVQEA